MKIQPKHILGALLPAVFLFVTFITCLLSEKAAFSDSERRELASAPSISADSLLSGEFMTDFEDYTLDQFPFRDAFRTLKSLSTFYLFGQLDNNDIYIADGVASKMEYPMNKDSIDYACERFQSLYDRYMKDSSAKIYTAVVPDKNAFLAEKSGHLAMDYSAFYASVKSGMPYAQYVDIAPLLEAEDYYATDTHWRQEKITDVADRLAEAMGTSLPKEYTTNTLDNPFYGVYYGQSALPLEADTLYYLTNDTIDGFAVYDHQNNKAIGTYDLEKAYGKDPYEIYLSGSLSLITIQNPNAETDKELIVFRDSFGSSLVPLLAQGYKTVTVVDIRYISPTTLDSFIDFEDQDVLFLYSTLVLNNSQTLK